MTVMKTRKRSASERIVDEFFEGTGVEVYDYLPDGFLTLVVADLGGGRDWELNFQVQDGHLLVWRERHGERRKEMDRLIAICPGVTAHFTPFYELVLEGKDNMGRGFRLTLAVADVDTLRKALGQE